MFYPEYDITSIKPASYNPRFISDAKIQLLRESLRVLGPLKPVIVRSDKTIIAGHQRTKSLRAEGFTKAPAYVIDGITKTDEVRFNQMHNGADQEIKDTFDYKNRPKFEVVHIKNAPEGWSFVKPDQIQVKAIGRNAVYKAEISRLLMKYGSWGNSICDQDGNVFVSSDYAACCKLLNIDLLLYCAPADKVELIKKYFAEEYGEFHYEHLEKNTYIQTLAQMNRLEGEKQFKSTLYENDVIPNITLGQRILDFGAGRMAYAKKLASAGHRILPLEFYTRMGATNSIDVYGVNRQITRIIRDVQKHGLFDVVVCDSVLNSVDSPEAETSVINTLRSFCKPLGKIILSGRRRSFIERVWNGGTSNNHRSQLYFLDKSGFTANYRNGNWFYQRFHTDEEILSLARHLSEGKPDSVRAEGGSWQIQARNCRPLSEQEFTHALKFEFSLPLPNNNRYNRSGEVIEALKKYQAFSV